MELLEEEEGKLRLKAFGRNGRKRKDSREEEEVSKGRDKFRGKRLDALAEGKWQRRSAAERSLGSAGDPDPGRPSGARRASRRLRVQSQPSAGIRAALPLAFQCSQGLDLHGSEGEDSGDDPVPKQGTPGKVRMTRVPTAIPAGPPSARFPGRGAARGRVA